MYRSGPRPRSWRGVFFPSTVEERISEFITSHPRASHPLAPPLWITTYQLQLLHGRVLHDAVPLRLSTTSISNNSNMSLVADLLKPATAPPSSPPIQLRTATPPTTSPTSLHHRNPFPPSKRPPIPAVAAMLALSPPRRTSSAFQSLITNTGGGDTTTTPPSPTPLWMTPAIEHLLHKAHPADADVSILIKMLEEYTKLLPPPLPSSPSSPHRYPFSTPGYRDYYSLVDIVEPVAILEAIDRGRKTIFEGKHMVVPSDDDLVAGIFTRQLSWKSLLSLKGSLSMDGADPEEASPVRPWDQVSGTTRLRDYRSNPHPSRIRDQERDGDGQQQHRGAMMIHSDDPIVMQLGEATPLRPLPNTHYRFDGTPMPDSSQPLLEAYASTKLRSLVGGMGMYEEEDIVQIDDAVMELSRVFPPVWIPLSAARELLPYRPLDDVRSYTTTTTTDPKEKRKKKVGGGAVVGDGEITGVEVDGERWYHSSSFPSTQCSRVLEMLLHNHGPATTNISNIAPSPHRASTDLLSPTNVTFLSATRFKIIGERRPHDGVVIVDGEEGNTTTTIPKRAVEGFMDSQLSTRRCRPLRAISVSSCQPLDLHPNSIIAMRKWCWQADVYTHVWGTEEEYETVGAPISGDPIGVFLHDTSGACLGYHYSAVFSTRYEYCLHRTLGGQHTFVKSKDGSLAATALTPTTSSRTAATLQ